MSDRKIADAVQSLRITSLDKQMESGELPHHSPSITLTFAKAVGAFDQASAAGIRTEDIGNETARRHEERQTAGGEDSAFNKAAAVGADLVLDESVFRLGDLVTKHDKFF